MLLLYFTKSVWMSLLSDSTIYPHFRLSAETYPLIPLFTSGRPKVATGHYVCYIVFPVPSVPVASLTSLKTGQQMFSYYSVLSQTHSLFRYSPNLLLPFDLTASRFRCNAISRTITSI